MRTARIGLCLLMLLAMVIVPVSASDYTPPPGVKGPDSVDLGGKTVTVVTFSWVSVDLQEGGKFAHRLEEAEELFNCNIELLEAQWDGYTELLMSRLLSGESINDIWTVPIDMYWTLIGRQALKELDGILPDEYYEELPLDTKKLNDVFEYMGKRYTIAQPSAIGPKMMAWNKTLLEKESLPDVYDLYISGEWTWDALEQIARQAGRDTDGDGVIDQYGLAMMAGWMHDMIFSNGARIVRKADDGGMTFALTEPEAITAMERYQDWMAADWRTEAHWEFNLGKTALAWGFGWDGYMPEGDFVWSYVPFPKGPDIDKYVFPMESTGHFCLPVNAADPESLIAVCSYLWRWEDAQAVKDDFVRSRAQDRESAQIMFRVAEDWDGEIFQGHETMGSFWIDGSIYQRIVNEILAGDSPAAVVNRIAPEAQVALDVLFGK